MRTTCTLFFGVLLSVCLTLYGPFNVAPAKGGAVFSMEICADGVPRTVTFDVDGKPIDPAQNCPDCLRCFQVVGNLTPATCSAIPSFVLLNGEAESPVAQNPVISKRHHYPVPRGPPAVRISMPDTPKKITFDLSLIGQTARSDGRLLFKDTFA